MNENLPSRDIEEAKKKLFEKMVMVINRTPLAYEIKHRFICEISQDLNHQTFRLTPSVKELPKLNDLQKLAKSKGIVEGINFTLGVRTFEQLKQYHQHFNICIKKAVSEIENSYEVDDLSYLESTKNAYVGIVYNSQHCFQGDVTRSNETALNWNYLGIDDSKDKVNVNKELSSKFCLSDDQIQHLYKRLLSKFIDSDTELADFSYVFRGKHITEIKNPIIWVDKSDKNRERLYTIAVLLKLLDKKYGWGLSIKDIMAIAEKCFRNSEGEKFNTKSSICNPHNEEVSGRKNKGHLYSLLEPIIDTMPEK